MIYNAQNFWADFGLFLCFVLDLFYERTCRDDYCLLLRVTRQLIAGGVGVTER